MPFTDPDRLSDCPPGTVLREAESGDEIVVLFDGRVFQPDVARSFVYADPDTELELVSMPSAHPSLHRSVAAMARDALVPFVESLAPGTVFVETTGAGRRNRYVKLWGSDVSIDNGSGQVFPYGDQDDRTVIEVVGSPVSPPDHDVIRPRKCLGEIGTS